VCVTPIIIANIQSKGPEVPPERFEFNLIVETVDPAEPIQPLLRAVQRVLSEADGVEVEVVTDVAPSGAKGGGQLALQLATSVVAGAMPVTIGLLHDWTRRRRGTCKLTVELGDGVRAEISDLDGLDVTLKRLEELGFPARG